MDEMQPKDGVSREELLERVALMEAMISEGRCTTGRYGWLFVLWGMVDLTALALQFELPHSRWVWPMVIAAGWSIQTVGLVLLRRRSQHGKSVRSRSVGAVWGMMGLAITLYIFPAMILHMTWQVSYLAGILMMVGLAHATSAAILRWRAQAAAAALWWAGGVATFFVHGWLLLAVVVTDVFFGLILFGLYAMARERRRGKPLVARHA